MDKDDIFFAEYTRLSDAEVIAEICVLAESDEPTASRNFARLVVNFVEDCKTYKNGRAIDQTLLAIVDIKKNHSRMATVLRASYSARNSLNEWFNVRDKVLEILEQYEPERCKKLMAGIATVPFEGFEEMDGLDAWQSIVKACAKYA
jgi:hypothetical protein